MLQERYFKSQTAENIADLLGDPENEELLSLAKEIYAEEFKTFCEECDEEDKTFETFIDEELCMDEDSVFIKILEAYAVKHNIKSALCSFVRKFDSNYTELYIIQIVPTSQKDLDDLKEMYEEYEKEKTNA